MPLTANPNHRVTTRPRSGTIGGLALTAFEGRPGDSELQRLFDGSSSTSCGGRQAAGSWPDAAIHTRSPHRKTTIVIALLACLVATPTSPDDIRIGARDLYVEAALAPDSPLSGRVREFADGVLRQLSDASPLPLVIDSPPDGAVFPADIAAPEFRWIDSNAGVRAWLVSFHSAGTERRVFAVTEAMSWRPTAAIWAEMKRLSSTLPARLSVYGFDTENGALLASGAISFTASRDPVAAPIFFRDVPLPFSHAFRNVHLIKWRLGDIASSSPPRVVLEGMSACGNCHSLSADGTVFGMDVDHGGDKGAYVLAPVREQTVLSRDDLLTWTDYRRHEKKLTYGLLSRVSPDGSHVVSTVKDRSAFLPNRNPMFSLSFVPMQGILAVYCRDTKRFTALPGADDPDFVHTSANWSPDGKWIVFARARAARSRPFMQTREPILPAPLSRRFLKEHRDFRYDLYRIPFDDGKGGTAEPITGASGNGRSNYFPTVSPDGKWIVFCQAQRFLFLQPDSELFILPTSGGQARRLECNTARMNSWHSWAPNGKWLVFSSKTNGASTQLFLAHIDAQGRSSPAVLLDRFGEEGRAANLPEFVDIESSGLQRIDARLTEGEDRSSSADDTVSSSSASVP